MPPPSDFSVADFLALICAIVMAIPFVLMPWLNIGLAISATGLRLLSEIQPTLQNDVSLLWLILLAAALGALSAVWSLLDSRVRRPASWVTRLARGLGLTYYALFFIQNSPQQNQSLLPVDATGLVGPGFGVALFATLGLTRQVFIPRPALALPTASTTSPDKVSSYKNFVLRKKHHWSASDKRSVK